MKQSIWSQDFQVNSFLVNPQKKLGIYALLNILQDVAWNHATHFGHGYDETLAQNTMWVLTRQKVKMESWPAWGETITIRTWVRPLEGPVSHRDFEILHNDQVIGTCATGWLRMNIETRTALFSDFGVLTFVPRTDYRLPYDAKKITIKNPLDKRATRDVRNSDLDMNEHVNNTRYVQWLLDSIPLEWHKRHTLNEYDVNFLAEARAGDRIDIFMSPETAAASEVQFQGVREGKTVFTAEMKISPA